MNLVKKILVGLFSIAFLFSFSMNNVSAEPSEEEALEKAQSVADNQQVSKEDLYDILKSEDYSDDLAQYAIDNVEKDWKENALEYADSLRDQDYSEEEVEKHLDIAKFTEDEIQYALGNSDDSNSDEEENNDESADNEGNDDNDEGTTDENEENNENDGKNDNEQDEVDENQDNNADEQESTDNNDDNQQAEKSTENDAADNNDEDEAAAVESGDGSDNEEGGRLPDTATSTFNWMLVGGASLAAGGLGVFLTRKKKAAAQK